MAISSEDTRPMANDSEVVQSQAIGRVTTVIGEAYLVLGNEMRPLESGDEVFSDDVIMTGDSSQILITFTDNTWLNMGPASQTTLDSEVFDPDKMIIASDAATDADSIQQALIEGNIDPSQLAPTAAGNAASGNEDEGSDAVFVKRSDQETTPDNEFESDPIGVVLSGGPQADDVLFDEDTDTEAESPLPPCDDQKVMYSSGFMDTMLDMPCTKIEPPVDEA